MHSLILPVVLLLAGGLATVPPDKTTQIFLDAYPEAAQVHRADTFREQYELGSAQTIEIGEEHEKLVFSAVGYSVLGAIWVLDGYSAG